MDAIQLKAVGLLLAEMQAKGITDKQEQAMLLGQVDHESNHFRRLEENLNYKPERLMAISRSASRAGLVACRAACAAGPAAVAELIYGGRMGNVAKGDGYKYRGRGYIQLTGKDNYTAASKATGVDFVNHPELAAQPEYAVKIAIWFWKTNVGAKGQHGNVKAATLAINGGTIGLDERTVKYNEYLVMLNKDSNSMLA